MTERPAYQPPNWRDANWRNAQAARYWMMWGIPAGIVAWLAAQLWEPLFWPVFALVGLPLAVAALYFDDNDYFCPDCRKRLRSGAVKCSHCASPVGKARVR